MARRHCQPSDPPTLKVSVQDNPAEVLDPKQIAMGKAMFMACAACHGRNAVGAGGPAPDLRESTLPLNPDAFWTVVHDGALIERGMPRVGYVWQTSGGSAPAVHPRKGSSRACEAMRALRRG